jgi:predicted Zn finger-like uncharacterized protein
MRLTCPNCGAQYEVPDEVIPSEGRDVQCSNCGDTWYQNHPDSAESDAELADELPETIQEPDPDSLRSALSDRPPAKETPPQQDVSEGVSDILREEAERETKLRAAEDAEPLESQPDLGLDNMAGDESSRRAQEASERMARMKGQPVKENDPAADPGARREMLPDIEEINSTLRASDEGAQSNTAVGPPRTEHRQKKKGGFTRGFALIVILGVVLALVYINAPKITNAVPQVEPAMSSYVSMVDQARVWLDAQLSTFAPKPEE